MKVAIMQPYIFPYIGYFQLIAATDKFVFYDDVNFMKRGWINRNRILINGEVKYLTIPLIKASQNRLINQIEFKLDENEKRKLLLKIEHAYAKAPYFSTIFELIQNVFDIESSLISELAISSVIQCCEYLDLDIDYALSSKAFQNTKEIGKADRLIEITRIQGADTYVNSPGGKELYEKAYFSDKGINLEFLKTALPEYPQFGNEFEPGLSIIDVLMFCSRQEAREMIKSYSFDG